MLTAFFIASGFVQRGFAIVLSLDMVCFVYGGGKGGGRIWEIFSIFTQVSKGAVAKDSVRFRNTAVACFTSFLGRFGGNGSTAFPRPYLLVEGDCLVKISCQYFGCAIATLASQM